MIVDHANPVHDGFCRCRECKPPLPLTYRDVLASRGRQPVVIQRTEKRPGDLVLDTWARPARSALTGEVARG